MLKLYMGMGLYVLLDYLAGASYHNFAPLFFEQAGYAPGQISLLTGLPPMVAVLMQPLWGMACDRCKVKNHAHLVVLLGASGAMTLFQPAAATSFAAMLGAVALFGVFATSATPMGETILLQHLEQGGHPYGPLRIWGTVAYGLGAQGMGLLLEGATQRFAWWTALWFGLAAAASLSVPRVSGGACAGGRAKGGFKPLLRNRPLMLLLALIAVLQMTQGLSFSFFALHFTQTLGGTKAQLGIAALIAALSEIPFLIWGDRLLGRFGARKLVLAAGITMTVRWALVACLRDIPALWAAQVLAGDGLIVLTFCTAKTMQRVAPQAHKASGQMLAAGITFGIGRGLVGPVGWLLSHALSGFPPVFWVMAAVCALAVVGMGLPLLHMASPGE